MAAVRTVLKKKNRGGRKRQQKTLWRGKIWLRLPKLSSLYRVGGGGVKEKQPTFGRSL